MIERNGNTFSNKYKVEFKTTLVLEPRFARRGGCMSFDFPTGLKEIRIPPLTQQGAHIYVRGGGLGGSNACLIVKIEERNRLKFLADPMTKSSKLSLSNRGYNWGYVFSFFITLSLVGGGFIYGEELLTSARYRLQPPAAVDEVFYPADQREKDLNILRETLYKR